MSSAPITVQLPRDRSAPGRARASIRDHAPGLSGDRLETAVLLVSELVTNAVLHGAGRIVLTIEAAGAATRFVVSDEGSGRPHVRDNPGPDGGWGLRLVEQLATTWGVRRSGPGVWFEL